MGRIIVFGLGPGNPRHLTLSGRRALYKGQPLYLRTGRHPLARLLRAQGIQFRTFDYIYRRAGSFARVYQMIAARLNGAAGRFGTVYYGVPGDPMAGEAVVGHLINLAPRSGHQVKIIPGLSFIEPALAALKLDLLDGVTVLDALTLDQLKEPPRCHLLLAQVYSRAVASRVKLILMGFYADSFPVTILRAAGLPEERVRRVPLYALDRQRFDHYTTLYLPPVKGRSLGDLAAIMARLRSAKGCLWDKNQTHHSLRQYLIEEAYEVIAAIDEGDDAAFREELGDLLLQVVFHSQIASEKGRFNLNQVIDTIAAKLTRRHPHVFGRENAASISQVMRRWEQIKVLEKKEKQVVSVQAAEDGLPALLGAYKVQKRAADLGFDWPQIDGAVDKLKEEVAELEDAYQQGISGNIEEEFGDFLFAAVNVARFLGINPELALGKALRKFLKRFQYIQDQAKDKGRPVNSYTLEELDRWWEEAKHKGKKS